MVAFAAVGLSCIALLGCEEDQGTKEERGSSGQKEGTGWRSYDSEATGWRGYGSGGGAALEETEQDEWESQEGAAWEEFVNGYSDGFNDGCEDLFAAAGGRLYEEPPYEDAGFVDEYTVFDCTTLEDEPEDIPFEPPEDPYDEGYGLGVEAGCDAIFDDTYEYTLYSVDGERISSFDC
jgi:hypothetical protein